MYQRITDDNPYETPMRIYPAVHYTMGGVWVDYDLETTIPGLYMAGECNFSDHGANRLGASALMQGLSTATGSFPHRQRLPGADACLVGSAPDDQMSSRRARTLRPASTSSCRSMAPARWTRSTRSWQDHVGVLRHVA
nr:FAD-binding protein [Nanchangia anserum]